MPLLVRCNELTPETCECAVKKFMDAVCAAGVEFRVKHFTVDGTDVKIQLWDSVGTYRYASVSHIYFRGTDGVVLIFDVTSRHSFEDLQVGGHCFMHVHPPLLNVPNKQMCQPQVVEPTPGVNAS